MDENKNMSIKVEEHEVVKNGVPGPVIVHNPGELLCESIVSDPELIEDSTFLSSKIIEVTISHEICKCLVKGKIDVQLEPELVTIDCPPFGVEIENQGLKVEEELKGLGLKEKGK